MKSHLFHLRSAGAQAIVLLAFCVSTASAQVLNPLRIIDQVDARTIASNGGGTAATLTLTPVAKYVTLTCNDPDGCTITMGESGIASGMELLIVNVSANTCTFSDSAGVSELSGTIALTQWQSLALQYVTDRWVQASSAGGSGTVTTTGSPASGELAKFSGAASVTTANLTGDVTTTGTVATTIANDAVSNAKLRNSGALSVIGRSANSSGDPADISATAATDAVLRESGSVLGFGTIATAGIANDAVTFAKMQNSSTTSVLVGRGGAAGAGDFQEITLGAGLSLAGTSLSSVVTGSNGGDVVGPSSSTDEAVARFDSTTGKLLQNTSTLTLSDAGAFTFADGVKQTFNPNGTNAGINVGSQAGDPGSPANGDLWYDSTANTLDARINGATVQLGGGSGKLAQVVNTQTGAVNTGTTTIPTDDTIPQNTEGTEFITLAITPTSAANKLQIDVVVNVAHNAATNQVIVAALFQDSTADAIAVMDQNAAQNIRTNIKFTHYMTAGTTSATTFKVRIGTGGASTVTLNGIGGSRDFGGVLASGITISEIVP
jgi:hypothetical protein